MTTFATYSPSVRPTGFDALLILVGHRLVSIGERLALDQARDSEAIHAHDERRRDLAAAHHSGLRL
ncbi:hypothetical protein ACX80T_07195 [Arthrobacter sp. Sr33]|uniref:hypothetical protein n=1 Tax=Arthrobacter sp. TB 23 TaxID=494419 RepID=UPI0002EE134B|nr:hypothetical protein [Arthrobacter sp. TB 23]